MDRKFSAHNTHIYGLEKYWVLDNHLRFLSEQPLIYWHPLLNELPTSIPGIYTIGGGRQIGKTTLLKQWVTKLLEANISPEQIIFYTGELIPDHLNLVNLLEEYIFSNDSNQLRFIIIDEVTYIKDWDKGIKFAADAGYFQNCIVMLTGSDLTLMQNARMTFPGRRGKADKVDFHIHSLSFKAFMDLTQVVPDLEARLYDKNCDANFLQLLYSEFQKYLTHGGYLTAINDIAREQKILPSTLKVYSDWIRGDILKRAKQEKYLKEIIAAIIKRYNKQVTWNALADDLSIDSHKTVADYCELLATMDALFIQHALLEDKLVAAPKKAKKLTFTDPFIYHALSDWLHPQQEPYHQILTIVQDPIISADLVEAVVSNHFARYYPSYYIKAAGEIDLAYVHKEKFWPIEIKWRNHLRPDDIKQIAKYKNGKVFSKSYHTKELNGIPIIPLPLALLQSAMLFHV